MRGKDRIGVLFHKFCKVMFFAYGKNCPHAFFQNPRLRYPLCTGKAGYVFQNPAQRHPLRVGKVQNPAQHNRIGIRGSIPCVWEKSPPRDVVRFPVIKVPASATVALHSKVLHSLHGRMSSGPPQPYFVEILRRGGNPAAREAVGTTLPFLRTAEPRWRG